MAVPFTFNAAKSGLSVVATPWLRALTDAIDVSSLSINAPAAVTLVVSVTSAEASMPSSFVPSVATSRPSKVLLVVIAPVIAPPDNGNAMPVTLVLNVADTD